MTSFLSLPNESLLLVFQRCDTFSSVIALSSTCNLLHSIYSFSPHSIFRHVGPRDIPAFDDAVMRVCATNIVMEHFLKGQLPPNPKMSPAEAQQICDWKHLIERIEDICLQSTDWGLFAYDCAKQATAPGCRGKIWLKWRERLHRLIYRFPRAPSNGDNHLLRYPMFNFEAYEDHEPIYWQLADSLCFLATVMLLDNCGHSRIFKRHGQTSGPGSLSKGVTVVPLGSFYPQRISMPARAQEIHQTLLLRTPLSQATEGSSWNLSTHLMNFILDMMYRFSSQPNHYMDDLPTPAPPLQVSQFITRKFLCLRVDDAFPVEEDSIVDRLLVCGIYVDEWPDDLLPVFDTPDGGGEYDASYYSD
ncbi:hypothetical protein BJX96DRAFT_167971 [Aspergillus floccosus]